MWAPLGANTFGKAALWALHARTLGDEVPVLDAPHDIFPDPRCLIKVLSGSAGERLVDECVPESA